MERLENRSATTSCGSASHSWSSSSRSRAASAPGTESGRRDVDDPQDPAEAANAAESIDDSKKSRLGHCRNRASMENSEVD